MRGGWHRAAKMGRSEYGEHPNRPSSGLKPANERMQLTWLTGCPNRAVSVHRLVVGRCGLGSAATQLMRAVGRLLRLKRFLNQREYYHGVVVSEAWSPTRAERRNQKWQGPRT